MQEREEIIKRFCSLPAGSEQSVILDVLLDIRDLLIQIKENNHKKYNINPNITDNT